MYGTVYQQRSYAAYLWLQGQQCDVIHFHCLGGAGYYSLAAQRQGLWPYKTTMVVGVHAMLGSAMNNINRGLEPGTAVLDFLEQTQDFMQRRSAEMADVLVSPASSLLSTLRLANWSLPERADVIPNALPGYLRTLATTAAARATTTTTDLQRLPVTELVFFGRLDRLKGLDVFCDAITRLHLQDAQRLPRHITFLGKSQSIDGLSSEAYVQRWASNWTVSWSVVDDKTSAEAVEFLRAPGRMAVLPSRVEVLPYAVVECLAAGIPFLASDNQGEREKK